MLLFLFIHIVSVSAGYLSVPIHRRDHDTTTTTTANLDRRAGSVTLEAINNLTGGGFYAQFSVGTPPQPLSFLLDTGSSDTWVNSVQTGLCRDAKLQTDQDAWCLPQFDPRASSSYHLLAPGGFNISYLDQKHVSGDYFSDSLTIGDKTIHNQQLGLALDSTRSTGIMGLGFSSNVAAPVPYPVVIDNMVSQGLINTAAFSLYLNDITAKSGTILFGAIDREKYYNRLVALPILSNPVLGSRPSTAYTVRLRSFSAAGDKIQGRQIGAILDSGSTISLLPPSLIVSLYRRFGIINPQDFPAPLIDCAHRNEKDTFDFEFDSVTIRVPIKEMIIDAFPDDAQQAFRNSDSILAAWQSVCAFGIGSTASYGINSESFALLGDTFIRSAYILYDLANHQIGIAQAKIDSSRSNIIEIAKDAKQIPSDSGAENDGVAAASPALRTTVFLLSIASLLLL